MLKLKTKEFQSLTRGSTPVQPILDYDTFVEIGVRLLERVELPAEQLYRLVGIGLANFRRDDAESSNQERPILALAQTDG